MKPETNWNQLLTNGMRVDDLEHVTPGDIVFLTSLATPLLAFTVHEITSRNNMFDLYMTENRYYRIGGHSHIRFQYAIRPTIDTMKEKS